MNSGNDYAVIIPNLNRRFSGITSTISAVIPEQLKEFSMCAAGHKFSDAIPRLSWTEIFKLTARNLPDGKPRIFHCRRNIEMLCGLLLKHVFRRKIYLIFTSTAQRKHSGYTKFLYKKMDMLLSTSPRAASFLEREPFAIIPHGVNSEIYFPAADKNAERQNLGLTNKKSIGIFGRVREQKGVREFVEAMCEVLPHYPDYNAVIVGKTTPKFAGFEKEMKCRIESCGLTDRFQWLGEVPFSRIPNLFRSMELVLCVSRNEGFGLTCLEAMSSGVPVIATQTGGFEMVVRQGIDGEIVPCNDAAKIVEKLNGLLPYPEKLSAMGAASRERTLSSFTIAKEAAGINAVYRHILS